jgi:hypothetical protein
MAIIAFATAAATVALWPIKLHKMKGTTPLYMLQLRTAL